MILHKQDVPIIIVNDFGYVEGGASAVAVKTALVLASAGRKVVFFCGQGPVCTELVNSSIEVICIGMHSITSNPSRVGAICNGLWNGNAYRVFRTLLCRGDLKGAIVHIHTWTKVLSASVFAAATKNGNPLILTVHDYFSACPNGGFYDYNEKCICDRAPLSVSCVSCNCDKRSYAQKSWRVMRQYIQDRWVRNNRHIHYAFVSDYCRDILVPYLHSAFAYRVLRNPVDHIRLDESVISYARDSFLYIGRLSPEKGADLFCSAVETIGAHGIVIGDGEMLPELKEKYSGIIEFTGWLEPDEMWSHGVARAIAVVQPSRLHETALLTPVQLLELGIPCIVPDRCAARDYVKEGVNGLLFKSGDVSDLERVMRKMLEKPICPERVAVPDRRYLTDLSAMYEEIA